MISKKKLIKVLCVIFLVVLVVGLRKLNVDFSHITIEGFREQISSLGFWGPLVYILFYIVRPLILLPAVIVSGAAGFIWGMKGFIYLQVAANLSAIIEFLVARYFARDIVKKFINHKAERIDSVIEKNGFWAVLVIRLVPNVVWDIQNLALGLTSVRFKDYVFATMIGIIPFSFVIVYFSSTLTSTIINPKQFGGIIISGAVLIGVYIYQQILRKKKNA